MIVTDDDELATRLRLLRSRRGANMVTNYDRSHGSLTHRALADADATRQVFLHLLKRIEALDLHELAEINRLTAKLEWPLRDLFGEVERAKAKNVFLDEGKTDGTKGLRRRIPETIQNSKLKTRSRFAQGRATTARSTLRRSGAFFSPEVRWAAFEGYEQRECRSRWPRGLHGPSKARL
jgi:DNA polymerase-3 subunit epsilon/ATP-dependent DNA helicase DinG